MRSASSMFHPASSALLVLLTASGCLPANVTWGEFDDYQSEVANADQDLQTQINSLQALVAAQAKDIANLQGTVAQQGKDIAALQAEVAALGDLAGRVGDTEVRLTVLEAWRETAEPVVDEVALALPLDAWLAGWLGVAGYEPTSSLDLRYATSADVEDGDSAVRAWVDGQGYLTASQAAAIYATALDVAAGDDATLAAAEEAAAAYTDDATENVMWYGDPGDITVTTEAELFAALENLERWHIPEGEEVTVTIASGAYSFDAPIIVRHPDAARLRIVGESSSGSPPQLYFNGVSGIVVDQGTTLGYLGNLSLQGDTTSGRAIGLVVQDGSMATIGELEVSDFGSLGVYVARGSFLLGDEAASDTPGWLSIEGSIVAGISVQDSSGARLPNVQVSSTGRDAGTIGVGIQVYSDSYLEATGAVVEATWGAGMSIVYGSFANVEGATLSDLDGDGFEVDTGSVLYAPSVTIVAANDVGFEVGNHSSVYAPNASVSADNQGARVSGNSWADLNNTAITAGQWEIYQVYQSFVRADGTTTGSTTFDITSLANDTEDFVYRP